MRSCLATNLTRSLPGKISGHQVGTRLVLPEKFKSISLPLSPSKTKKVSKKCLGVLAELATQFDLIERSLNGCSIGGKLAIAQLTLNMSEEKAD